MKTYLVTWSAVKSSFPSILRLELVKRAPFFVFSHHCLRIFTDLVLGGSP